MAHADIVKWHCVNGECKWSSIPTIALPGEPAPRCICGDVMQTVETPRVITYLDFLRGEPMRLEKTAVEED
jgi:hypothetical protein